MGTLKNGASGGFSGKAGSFVGYRTYGKDRIRSLPKKSNKPPTEKQLISRARFKVIQEWRSYLTPVFAVTFKNHSYERSAQNAAHRFNAHIVKGDYPNFEIDPTLAVISEGKLPPLKELKMQVVDQNQLDFSWSTQHNPGSAAHDLITILICYDQMNYYEGSLSIAQRFDGKCSYSLQYPKNTKYADIYITVISNNRENAANSVYVGRVDLIS